MLRWLAKRRGERGSILVFVGVGLPVLVAALALVLDVGDWFVQKRSLQNQVDAATLAGSARWASCFSVGGQDVGPSGKSAGSAVMQQEATAYGGGTYNSQIGGDLKGQLQPLAFNQTVYPTTAPPSATADDTTPDPCFSYDAGNNKCNMSSPAAGCRIQFDVKATENKLPLIFGGFLPSVVGPNLHAVARSELREVAALQPSMPLAVPDISPQSVSVTFVDMTGNNKSTPFPTPCSTTAGSNATFVSGSNCAFVLNLATYTPVPSGGQKTWSFTGLSIKVPAGESKNIDVRFGIGATAGACPLNSSGGTGYVCVESNRLLTPATSPDPPVNSLTITPALADGANIVGADVALQGAFSVFQACSGTSGRSYSCPPNPPTNVLGDPTIDLRFSSASGSQTYAINCGTVPGNTGGDFKQQIQYGCADFFAINDADICPDSVINPKDCAPVGNAVGDMIGQLQQGMNSRLASGATCAPNYYPNTTTIGSDPRIFILIVTDFSAFFGNGGNTEVPVVTYGAFYVTGWDGAPGSCDTYNELYPVSGKPHGDIWGHFITYVGSGTPSGKTCAVGALAPCVPALVK
jgi:hypothetical protein